METASDGVTKWRHDPVPVGMSSFGSWMTSRSRVGRCAVPVGTRWRLVRARDDQGARDRAAAAEGQGQANGVHPASRQFDTRHGRSTVRRRATLPVPAERGDRRSACLARHRGSRNSAHRCGSDGARSSLGPSRRRAPAFPEVPRIQGIFRPFAPTSNASACLRASLPDRVHLIGIRSGQGCPLL